MIKAGDRVKFCEATKKQYMSWMSDPEYGMDVFCEELRKIGGVDSEFTIKAIVGDYSKDKSKVKVVTLAEMPGWYFRSNEFEEKEETPIKVKEEPVRAKESERKGTMTLTEAYLELCIKYNKQKEINKDLVDEIYQKDRIIRAFDEDAANLESDNQELKEIVRRLLNVKDENYNNVLERYAPAELLEEAGEYIGE